MFTQRPEKDILDMISANFHYRYPFIVKFSSDLLSGSGRTVVPLNGEQVKIMIRIGTSEFGSPFSNAISFDVNQFRRMFAALHEVGHMNEWGSVLSGEADSYNTALNLYATRYNPSYYKYPEHYASDFLESDAELFAFLSMKDFLMGLNYPERSVDQFLIDFANDRIARFRKSSNIYVMDRGGSMDDAKIKCFDDLRSIASERYQHAFFEFSGYPDSLYNCKDEFWQVTCGTGAVPGWSRIYHEFEHSENMIDGYGKMVCISAALHPDTAEKIPIFQDLRFSDYFDSECPKESIEQIKLRIPELREPKIPRFELEDDSVSQKGFTDPNRELSPSVEKLFREAERISRRADQELCSGMEK